MDQMLLIAADLGKQAGMGRDVQIKFDLKVLEAAFTGHLDLQVDKHAKDVDDATKLSEAYVKAQGSATVFDATAGNQRKLISTTRKMIKLGTWPKGGQGEPMQTVNNLMTLRQKLRQDPRNSKKLDDAHNTLMRFATQQIKRDQVIPDTELPAFCHKPVSDIRSAEEVLESIRKTANNLRLGKVSNCADLDNSAEVQAIIHACTKRIANIIKSRSGNTATP
jgi:ribosomal protein L30/L7E